MHLLPMTDAHFAWLLGEAPPPADAPRVAEGGSRRPRSSNCCAASRAEVGGEAAWMMVVDGEGVGMISVKERDAKGRWDIGYGVAPTREGRGHATAAVAALKQIAPAQGATGLTAETLPDSGASPRVLRRNGFRVHRTIRPSRGWHRGSMGGGMVTDIDTDCRRDLLGADRRRRRPRRDRGGARRGARQVGQRHRAAQDARRHVARGAPGRTARASTACAKRSPTR